MSSWALALVVVVPLGTAALGLVGIATPRLQGLLAVAGAAIHAVIAAILFQAVSDQGLVALQASNWPAPFGITLVADTLSAVLVMLAALVGLAVAIHAVAELGRPVFAAGFVWRVIEQKWPGCLFRLTFPPPLPDPEELA